MKVAIIEPHLVDYTGHYYSFVSELKRGFEELGDQVEVFLPANLKADINGTSMMPLSPISPKACLLKRYKSFLRDTLKLVEVIKDAQQSSDLLIFSTADDGRILAAIGLFKTARPAILYFHTLPALINRKMKSWKLFVFLVRLRKPKNLYFLTTSGIDRDIKMPSFPSNVKLLPGAPYPFNIPVPLSRPDNTNVIYLAYMGAPAKQKNFPKFVELISNSPENYGFIVQCNVPSCFYESDILDAVQSLKRLKRENTILLESSLSKENYYKALNQSSIVWCLYDRDLYKGSISGILIEAWVLGKPVLTTAGTWMAKQVEKFGGGIALDPSTLRNILAAIERIRAEYPRFSREAESAGTAFYEKNNGPVLARFIKESLEKIP